MANVESVKQHPKKPDNAYIKFDDGTEAWCPNYELASALEIGKPLPEGWYQDEGEYGPRAFPPRDKKGGGGGGGKTAYRNTREGMAQEQVSIHRSVALEHAVRYVGSVHKDLDLPLVIEAAEVFYDWLRSVAPLSLPSVAATDAPGTPNPSPASGGTTSEAKPAGAASTPPKQQAGGGDGSKGKAPAPACPACSSPQIARKGRTWRCLVCEQEWEA